MFQLVFPTQNPLSRVSTRGRRGATILTLAAGHCFQPCSSIQGVCGSFSASCDALFFKQPRWRSCWIRRGLPLSANWDDRHLAPFTVVWTKRQFSINSEAKMQILCFYLVLFTSYFTLTCPNNNKKVLLLMY